MSVDKSQVYILREFYLLWENSSPKYISQYHFTSWPDRAGMPDNLDDILTLLQEVGQRYNLLKIQKLMSVSKLFTAITKSAKQEV